MAGGVIDDFLVCIFGKFQPSRLNQARNMLNGVERLEFGSSVLRALAPNALAAAAHNHDFFNAGSRDRRQVGFF